MHSVVQLDAAQSKGGSRGIEIEVPGSSGGGMSVLLFSGKRINEPIAWHGPFVMNTQSEIQQVISEIRAGTFPPVRVPWDYKRLSAFPAERAVCKEVK